MAPTLAPSYLRGRLARRLLTVFVLVSVAPVLLASLIAYRQLMLSTHAARTRELQTQVRTASLAFLAQLQTASAQLAALRPGQPLSRSERDDLLSVKFLRFDTPAARARALAGLAKPLRTALIRGQTTISWGSHDNHPTLLITRPRHGGSRLVRGQLNVPRLLDEVAGPAGGASMALVDSADPARAIVSAYGHLSLTALTSVAEHESDRLPSNSGHFSGGRWRGAAWELFLPSNFAAEPVRLDLAEPADSADGLSGLRWMIPLALLGAMAFAALLAIRQLRRYLGPLETLTIATRRLTEQHEHTHVSIETDDELAILGDNFNRMAEELLRRARRDGLTGLANRDFFRQSLDARLSDAAGASTALLYIDLDAFKKINDSAGHEAGDQMLVAVAERLRACVSAGALLARLGGDEFAVVLSSDTPDAEAAALAQRILQTLQSPFVIGGFEQRVSASIGIAIAPENGDTVELLLRNADIAMYAAKDSGRNGIARFNADMHERLRDQIVLEVELQGAIQRGELALFYQPITDGEHLTGVEALVRWRRANGEQVSPSVFIPLAEHSSLISAIGAWVLHRACADFARWTAAGIAPGYVAVNVSPKQLLSADFVPTLHAALESNAMSPDRLHVEITESAIAEGRQVEQALERMSALGVRLALDDFGTGYSSLSHLHRLPFDVIKIDQSFVNELPGSPIALQLVRAITSMGHSLEKEVLAEGVETEAQRQLLRRLGCDSMQGYLMGRPMSESALRARLVHEREHSGDSSALGLAIR